ncbi:unnamed protein product [Penicillium manginii]
MKRSEEPTRTKRRKIAVACDDCRTRKVRCDGVQPGMWHPSIRNATRADVTPVCGPCSKRADGEDRIKRLESPKALERASLSAFTPHQSLSSLSPAGTPGGQPETPINRIQHTGFSDQPDALDIGGRDGVNAMMGSLDEGRASQGFFGSSSAAGFMRQIKIAVDRRVSSPQRHLSSFTGALGSSLLSNRNERHQSTVPVGNMKGEYTKIWRGDTQEQNENMLMCTFNVIFALASQLADFVPPHEREAAADAFFSRAKGLFQFNLWDTGSAGLIQCLLLMAQYLQSTDSAHQCWIVTGLAIRNAQSLGLHLPQTIARFSSFQEQQLARKLWHGCVLMDRVISMTFGRPAMISKISSGAVPLPVLVDDEFIPVDATVDPTQPTQKLSMMAFYAKTLELYEIMNEVLLSLHKPVSDDGPEETHQFSFTNTNTDGEHTIFELDHSLTRWAQGLPAHLRTGSTEGAHNPVFFRQGIVLNARFLHIRILLFRPILSKYCTMRDNSTSNSMIAISNSLPRRVALQCSIICVRVAQESIEMIYQNVPADGTGGPLPAWWYNILCEFSKVPRWL